MTLAEEMVEALCLPGRAEAEAAICRRLRAGRPAFVLAVLATGVPLINEQYGYPEGDRVLAALAARLAKAAGGSRSLFRWSATSFVIISASVTEIRKAASVAGATTAVFSMWPQVYPDALFDRIDDYVASCLACHEAA